MVSMGSFRFTWNGDELTRAARASAAIGLNRAADSLLSYAVPLTPYLNGDLTDSYGVHQATAATVEEGAQVQNHSAYAKRQHEGVGYNFTTEGHPQAQAKFLEQPAKEHARDLGALIAEAVRQGLR